MKERDMVTKGSGLPEVDRQKNLNYISPAVDILEDGEGFVLMADVPGIEKKNLDISVEKGFLTLEGRVSDRYRGDDSLFTKSNCAGYTRRFKLSGQFDQNKIDAELKNGVLTIRVPKGEVAKPKRIEITVH